MFSKSHPEMLSQVAKENASPKATQISLSQVAAAQGTPEILQKCQRGMGAAVFKLKHIQNTRQGII